MPRILIVGGGIAGLTVATTLTQRIGTKAEVTVLTKEPYYVGGPTRPLVLTNEEKLERIIRGYHNVGLKGIKIIYGTVTGIDPANRIVKYNESPPYGAKGGSLSYDYLVIAPGVVFDGSGINGYDKWGWINTNVYDPGMLMELKNKLWLINQGTVLVYAPKAPYRCAPAPTETALLAHTILKHRGVRDKVQVIHIDANDKTQPPAIADKVKEIYDKAGIELITNQEIVELNDHEVTTKSGERYKFNVLAMLEPNRAPSFIRESGLGDEWFNVRSPVDLRNVKYDDVLAAGDVAKLPYPKNQEIAFESALFVVSKIMEDLGINDRVNTQYAFIGWAYLGNVEGRLETLSLQFGFDYTQQPPKVIKDPDPKREYTEQKDHWMQTYLGKLFGQA
ncbi:FAD/NAD(P)-binding oxidoreductase [Caldivirga sp.]|uniref:NAD(P)/FAD-dependent oxidoreductase n=1 Tax=Caldivirga sp. TaxID=2080243 RepID=UPI0025BF3D5A|nr:FAD/NAD(P)-binding oxidoreductase [Caldivirga sp.]